MLEIQQAELNTNADLQAAEGQPKGPVGFVTLMEIHFHKRLQRNPNYSRRAYARDLGIDQSHLSKLLSGKRSLTEELIFKIGMSLGLPELEIRAFAEIGEVVPEGIDYAKVRDEEIGFLSDWHAFAIIELMQTKGFRSDINWIAKRLGISVEEVRFSLAKLESLKMIAVTDSGGWTVLNVAQNWSSGGRYTTESRRKLQKQALENAIKAVEQTPIEKRYNMNMTIAVDSTLVPEVTKRIREFNESLRTFINSVGNADSVYQVTLGFVPLTEEEK